MKKINVLLVDDHKLIRDGLKSIINTTKNITVVSEFSCGKDAIKFLEKDAASVDVILMDITMPELNGIDTTEIIKKLHPKLNIIALTMHSEETYIIKMIKAGALGYILKDSSKEILIEAIETVAKNEKYYSYEVSMKLITMFLDDEKPNEPKLSGRELEIIKHIAKGFTNKEIAKEIAISDRTVETHRRNIIKKLNVKNTAELVGYAVNNGLSD
jgi:DNA-binding NarL/FixJ family response regulator